MRLQAPPWLIGQARVEWDKRVGRWAGLGHLLPIDETMLGLYVLTVALRGRLLEQIRGDDLEDQPIALEMLREMSESLADWRRELQLPEDD